MMKEKLKHTFGWIPKWISVPFVILLVASFVPLFLDENGYAESYRQDAVIKSLKSEMKSLQDSIALYQHKIEAFNSDKEEMERVAREQYHMKRPTEDLYLTDIR